MVDATKVSSIKIDTGYAGIKEYPFFTRVNRRGLTIDDAQVSIVLGGNGSGKSTIARALSGDGVNKDVEFLDKEEKTLSGDCSNVHVFNEEYVIKNFRTYKLDYLEPVVLLGKSGDILDKIDKVEKNIVELKKRSLA